MAHRDASEKNIDTAYILVVNFDHASISSIRYKRLPSVPHSFAHAAFGNFRGRMLLMGGHDSKGHCFEFDQEEFQGYSKKGIPSLNINRWGAASTFIHDKVMITGGYSESRLNFIGGFSNGRLDSIEILDWDDYTQGSQWILSESKLPIKVCSHTLIPFEHKLYLIGGNTLTNFDTIWEGLFNSKTSTVNWVEKYRLQRKRQRHFSFVILNQLIIFGGYNVEDDVVEIIEGNELKQGPKVPFKLDTDDAQAVLDRQNRVIITSKYYGLIIYDHRAGSFQNFPSFRLREERDYYAAILQ